MKRNLSLKYLFLIAGIIFISISIYYFFQPKSPHLTGSSRAAVLPGPPATSSPSPASTSTPAPTRTASPTPSPVPLRRTVRVGVVVDDYANRSGTIPSLENSLGLKFSTISIFKQFGHPTNSQLVPADLQYIKSSGKTLMVSWEPWNPLDPKARDYLAEIGTGSQDTYINDFALSVRSYGSPVIIRFGHEMNGDWYPWGRKPGAYVSAYRRVVELFRNQGVANVRWMWSVNHEPLSGISGYYPGSAYVDLIGIDGFNFGTSQSWSKWQSFRDIFQPAYSLISGQYSKPIIISELASAELGGSKPDWIKAMSADLSARFPAVSEIIWFNLHKETDWRLESSAASLDSFKSNFSR